MERFNRVLTGVENVLAAGALGLAALISIVNITIRQFGGAFFWSEEAIIYLIIFSTFLGAVITLRHNEHVSVDILSVFLGRRGKNVLALVAVVTTIVYLAIMSVLGWMLIAEPFSRSTVTPATQLPLWLVELAVPIGMTLMLLRAFELLWRTWKHGADPADPDDVLAAEAEATGLTIEEIRASHEAIVSGKGEALADAVEHSREAHRHHGPRSPDSPPLQDDRYRSDTEEETDR